MRDKMTTLVFMDIFFLLFYALVLTWIYMTSPGDAMAYIFSEMGPFEIASFLSWFLLAFWVVLVVRPVGATTLAMAFLAVVAGMRELDMHNAFTRESISRISYYLNPDVALVQKLFVVLLLGLLAATVLYLGRKLLVWLRGENGLHHEIGQILVLAVILIPLTKIMDRFPAYMQGFLGITLSPDMVRLFSAYEEGFEMVLPLLFLQTVFLLPKYGANVRQTGRVPLSRLF